MCFPQLPHNVADLRNVVGQHHATRDFDERNDNRFFWSGRQVVPEPDRHHDGGAPIEGINVLLEPRAFEVAIDGKPAVGEVNPSHTEENVGIEVGEEKVQKEYFDKSYK